MNHHQRAENWYGISMFTAHNRSSASSSSSVWHLNKTNRFKKLKKTRKPEILLLLDVTLKKDDIIFYVVRLALDNKTIAIG